MKKVLSLFLSILMLCSITAGVDLSAQAATYSGSCGSNVTWSLNTSTGKLTISGSGDMENYDDDSPWLEKGIFVYIKKVTIQSGVTSVGDYAFCACWALASISLPNTITRIGDSSFRQSGLESITIPSKVTYIGESAFENTYITSVSIPSSVKTIGKQAFAICRNLKNIKVDESNKYYSSKSGVLFNKKQTKLINYPAAKTATSYKIPNTVKSIETSAFESIVYTASKLKSITIPKSVTEIGDYAFCNTAITSITLPNSITSIGESAFDNCRYLESITLPNSITGISDYVFWGCDNLKSITIPNTVKSIGNSAFGYCENLKTVTYLGSKSQYKKISIGDGNEYIKSAKISYVGTVTLSASKFNYTGKAKKPTVTVKDGKGNTINSKNYTVSYVSRSTGKTVSSMKDVGKYYVKIKFKGDYSGTVKKTVTIKPKSTSISSLSASSKGFTVKWGKVTTGTTGYQVQYSTSSDFSSKTTKTISSNSTTSKKITGLKAKKKYYVRVRTYKTVKIDGKSTKIYSSWSSAKTVTTKK